MPQVKPVTYKLITTLCNLICKLIALKSGTFSWLIARLVYFSVVGLEDHYIG